MKNFLPRLLLLSLVACLMGSAHAQISLVDLNLDDDISSWYDDNAGPELLEIYEGKVFQLNINIVTRRTFSAFKSANWIDGEVLFRGKRFFDIPMKYDLYSDQLTVLNVAGSPIQPIIPNQDDIEYFNLEGDLFLNLRGGAAPEGIGGFYHILYDGADLGLVTKRSKRQIVEGRKLEFLESVKHYIRKGDQFYRFKGKKTFFELFPDNKNQIKGFITSRGLKIKADNENALVTLIDHCQSLINPE